MLQIQLCHYMNKLHFEIEKCYFKIKKIFHSIIVLLYLANQMNAALFQTLFNLLTLHEI